MKGFILGLAFVLPLMASAQSTDSYQIEVQIDNFEGSELYLAYYLINNQYILDTVPVTNGVGVFSGKELLKSGMYLVVLPPDNRYFQLLIDQDDQIFKVHANNPTDPGLDLQIEGSADNQLFYDYLKLLAEQRPKANKLREEIDAASGSKKEKLEAQMEKLNDSVLSYQMDIVEKYPNTLTAALIKSNLPIAEMPEFEGEDAATRQWQWSKKHYFDNLDLADPRMLRMPFLFQRVDNYIQKMTVQHPDSISESLYRVLQAMLPAEETFKHFVVHYVNEYAASKIIGFDAVYVFLVDTYYAKGLTPWTEQEQLDKMVDNANRLRPLLIGKVAPDFSSQDKDGNQYTLHTFEADYTILFFWDPGCGHCKKSMPDMINLYNEYKDKGVEIFAVCTKFYNEMESCWDFVEEKEIGIWLNTVDPYHRSKYKTIYDIKSTPQIYILDKDKTILYKRLSVEQIPDILDQLLLEKESLPEGSH
ncbi:MAG: redoxin domain-containing protein [Saprospiraceae bacterium]|nr:redoxin domain-containing protein [Saprospiraceae bacterium]